jgi:hypothetical protein
VGGLNEGVVSYQGYEPVCLSFGVWFGGSAGVAGRFACQLVGLVEQRAIIAVLACVELCSVYNR